jgi:hypothetical protein
MPAPVPDNVTPVTTDPSVHPRHVVGSASISVLGQLAGPRRVATVLHAGADAVYLDVAGACVAVLSARAVRVPCGVRTALTTLPDVSPGEEVVVVDGSVVLPGCEVLVTDIVDATVPVLTGAASVWGAERIEQQAESQLDATRGALPAEALARLAAADPRAVIPLLGLGGGLTPLGDDVLCGWLAAAVARRHPELPAVRSEVALAAARRTTTLSATLLRCAARGEGVPEFRELLSAMPREDEPAVKQSVELLLDVGETSGAGLLLGAVLALGWAS